MLVLELERRKQGKTQAEVAIASHVDPAYICRAEKSGLAFPGHLERLASALHWRGEPADLLKEVN